MSNESKKVETKGAEKNKRSFFKDFKAEIKKVIWPTPKQLVNNTVAVISIVLITSAIVFILDFVFEAASTYGIDKIKEALGITIVEDEHDHDHDHDHESDTESETETDTDTESDDHDHDSETESGEADSTTENTESENETDNTQSQE